MSIDKSSQQQLSKSPQRYQNNQQQHTTSSKNHDRSYEKKGTSKASAMKKSMKLFPEKITKGGAYRQKSYRKREESSSEEIDDDQNLDETGFVTFNHEKQVQQP